MKINEIAEKLKEFGIEIDSKTLKADLGRLHIKEEEISTENIDVLVDYYQDETQPKVSNKKSAITPTTNTDRIPSPFASTNQAFLKVRDASELDLGMPETPLNDVSLKDFQPRQRVSLASQIQTVETDGNSEAVISIIEATRLSAEADYKLDELTANLFLKRYGLSTEGTLEEKVERIGAYHQQQRELRERSRMTYEAFNQQLNRLLAESMA